MLELLVSKSIISPGNHEVFVKQIRVTVYVIGETLFLVLGKRYWQHCPTWHDTSLIQDMLRTYAILILYSYLANSYSECNLTLYCLIWETDTAVLPDKMLFSYKIYWQCCLTWHNTPKYKTYWHCCLTWHKSLNTWHNDTPVLPNMTLISC